MNYISGQKVIVINTQFDKNSLCVAVLEITGFREIADTGTFSYLARNHLDKSDTLNYHSIPVVPGDTPVISFIPLHESPEVIPDKKTLLFDVESYINALYRRIAKCKTELTKIANIPKKHELANAISENHEIIRKCLSCLQQELSHSHTVRTHVTSNISGIECRYVVSFTGE